MFWRIVNHETLIKDEKSMGRENSFQGRMELVVVQCNISRKLSIFVCISLVLARKYCIVVLQELGRKAPSSAPPQSSYPVVSRTSIEVCPSFAPLPLQLSLCPVPTRRQLLFIEKMPYQQGRKKAIMEPSRSS